MINSPEMPPPNYTAMQPPEGHIWQIPESLVKYYHLDEINKFLEERELARFETYGKDWPILRPLAPFAERTSGHEQLSMDDAVLNVFQVLEQNADIVKTAIQKALNYDGGAPPPPPGQPPVCGCDNGNGGVLNKCVAPGTTGEYFTVPDGKWLLGLLESIEPVDTSCTNNCGNIFFAKIEPDQATWMYIQKIQAYGYACTSTDQNNPNNKIGVWATKLDPRIYKDGSYINGISSSDGSSQEPAATEAPQVIVIIVTATPEDTETPTKTPTPTPTDTLVPTPTKTPRPSVPLGEMFSEGNIILSCSYAIIPVGIIIISIVIGTQASSLAHEGLHGVRQRMSQAKENKQRTNSLRVQEAQYERQRH